VVPLYEGVVRALRERLVALRWLQQGRLQLYLLYVLLAVVSMLTWDMVYGGLPR
jgi:hypothetical protein